MNSINSNSKRKLEDQNFQMPRSPFVKKTRKTSVDYPNWDEEKNNYFSDNFSQFFQSQFVQLAPSQSVSNKITAARIVESKTEVNSSRFVGEDSLVEDEWDSSAHISPGQRVLSQQNQSLNDAIISDEDVEISEHELARCDLNSSELFVNEISAIQMNVDDMIDDALNEEKFTVFKSNVTTSEYMQLQRNSQTDKTHLSNEEPTNGTTEREPRNTNKVDEQKYEEENRVPFLNSDLNFDDDFDDIFDTSLIEGEPGQKIVTVEEEAPRAKGTTRSNSVNLPVSASKFYVMGRFFGLPEKVKKLIQQFKGINDLYDWQKECLQLPAIERKQNLIYGLPTSGGKTLVSEILILREIVCRRRNCLFILPYVSIVQEKVYAMAPFALNLDFLVEEYAAGKGSLPPRMRRKKKSVYIATIEKAMALFDSLLEHDRANELGLIVIDEIHMIGEGSRGAMLEALMTKVQYVKAGIQIVGMSATIGNLKELAEFLDADVYSKDFRPVELTEYVKCGSDIMRVKKDATSIDDIYVTDRSVCFNYNDEVQRMDPDHIAGLVAEIVPEKSCLIFCPSKKNCENLASLLSRILSKRYLHHMADEKKNLIKAIENDLDGKICPILAKTIPQGFAYHHSGLTADERRHLEDAFRQNILCVICCTSTLAAGVNLPAKRVIIRSPYVGRDFISLSRYKQMIGRAGRAGFGDAGESFLICSARDNDRVTQLLFSPMDEAISQMQLNESRALNMLILSAVGLKIAETRSDLQKLVGHTLMSVQKQRLKIDLIKLVDQRIAKLFRSKALKTCVDLNNPVQEPSSSFREEINLTQKTIVLTSKTKLEVSQIGKSSFKSGIDLERAKIVYSNLTIAQRNLVLLDEFHLLFLVTPEHDATGLSQMPDPSLFYEKYSALNSDQKHTANVIGITESVALKIITGRSLKSDVEQIVKKFFITMVLNELWHWKPISEVSNSFKIDRGLVQNLSGMAAIEASCLLKFCEELESFWMFRELFRHLTQRLSNICITELMPLMELPCVRRGRAMQLYTAGFKKVEDVARAKPNDLLNAVDHLSRRVADQLIAAAKVMVLEKLENLREEVKDCLDIYLS